MIRAYWNQVITSQSQSASKGGHNFRYPQLQPCRVPPAPKAFVAPGGLVTAPVIEHEHYSHGSVFTYHGGPVLTETKHCEGDIDRTVDYGSRPGQPGGAIRITHFYKEGHSKRAEHLLLDRTVHTELSAPSVEVELPKEYEINLLTERKQWLEQLRSGGAQVVPTPYIPSQQGDGFFMPRLLGTASKRDPGLNLEYAKSFIAAIDRGLERLAEVPEGAFMRFEVELPINPGSDMSHKCYLDLLRKEGVITCLIKDTVASADQVSVLYPALEEAMLARREKIHAWTLFQPPLQNYEQGGCEIHVEALAQASRSHEDLYRELHDRMRTGQYPPGLEPDETVLYGALQVYHDEDKIFRILPGRAFKNMESNTKRKKYYDEYEGDLQVINSGLETIPERRERLEASFPAYNPRFQATLPIDSRRIKLVEYALKDLKGEPLPLKKARGSEASDGSGGYSSMEE